MRALIIDPTTLSVKEQNVAPGLEPLQKIVGGYIEAIYPARFDAWWGDHHVYLNEEGRLDPVIAAQRWSLQGWPEPWLVGPAIVLLGDDSGDEVDCTLSLEGLRARVTFL